MGEVWGLHLLLAAPKFSNPEKFLVPTEEGASVTPPARLSALRANKARTNTLITLLKPELSLEM